ncbi:MAG: class I SAM-dependent methyltransferase [Rhodobiaceae bacterium]|nr:class I SAM-dependent methyltransferase [Planctomycetales bacterium]MCC0013270.1 class I SAM-dependent methyltransferase [Rhodobiaceae bacterium]
MEFYDRDADKIGERYTHVRFEDVQRKILAYLPPHGSKILDVGAGSGRDAYALAQRGFAVTAVEPAAGLRRWAQHSANLGFVEWIDDRLPELEKLRSRNFRYDFILCSAVLMHLPPSQLHSSMTSLREMLVPGGILAISVRNRIDSDPSGVFYDLSDENLLAAAKAEGLDLIESSIDADGFNRSDVRWRSFVFRDTVGHR